MQHGLTVDLGASAVLDVGGIAVIVTTHRGAANDPTFFAARCAGIIDVDCPGPAMVDVEKLRRNFKGEESRSELRRPR